MNWRITPILGPAKSENPVSEVDFQQEAPGYGFEGDASDNFLSEIDE